MTTRKGARDLSSTSYAVQIVAGLSGGYHSTYLVITGICLRSPAPPINSLAAESNLPSPVFWVWWNLAQAGKAPRNAVCLVLDQNPSRSFEESSTFLRELIFLRSV